MRYFCLVCDYDGTIATAGQVDAPTRDALQRVRQSGRKLILATGRELDDLLSVLPEAAIFDRIVAENGGLLYRPKTRERHALTGHPPRTFVEELTRRAVTPLSVGETMVSTRVPHETDVLNVIQKLGLELQVTFNKGAVMVLPSGVNKGTGVRAALDELGLSQHGTVGVGDAENDHAFLEMCEFSVAVQNALPVLKERADFVTAAPNGAGVAELIDQLVADDLAGLAGLERHKIVLGKKADGETFAMGPYGSRLVVAGPSGSGKSTFVSLLIERLVEHEYQVCVIDPEGDYDELESFVTLGRPGHRPDIPAILNVLDVHTRSVTVNLVGVSLEDRPAFFQKALSRIQELRAKTGRPQWIVVDEAHQVLPASLNSAGLVTPKELASIALVTVHPEHVSREVLTAVKGLVLVGSDTREIAAKFSENASARLDISSPELENLSTGTVVIWQFASGQPPIKVKLDQTRKDRRRHRQKYAAGNLGEDKSFYFRGPKLKMNLRAQNLNLFAQLAQGIDDATWNHHLRAHDYSSWIRDSVKDDKLAAEVHTIEDDKKLSSAESRRQLLEAIRKYYTAPA